MKNRQNRYLLNCMYLNQTSMGIYLLLIGAVLPLIRAEYGLSYKLSGIMMGVQSCGYFLAGLAAPLLPGLFGIKKTYLALANLAMIGLGMILFTGNPLLLLCAMLLTGLSKGSCGNYNNSIVSNLTGNDASSLNFLQACFAIGACIAPLIALICGASWRIAFLTEILIGIAILVYCLGMKIGKEAYPVSVSKSGMDFGFFRSKVFWICAAFLSCYMAIEACIMGFLVTYYVDTGLDLPAQLSAVNTCLRTCFWSCPSAWLSAFFSLSSEAPSSLSRSVLSDSASSWQECMAQPSAMSATCSRNTP